MKAGTPLRRPKDYLRVESARTDSAATWTTWVGPISMESSDPQLIGWRTDGITDAAYQATYRTCMRGMDSEKIGVSAKRGLQHHLIRRTVQGSAGMASGR